MPKFFVSQAQVRNEKIYIEGQDVKHIKNVLRMKIGEHLEICNADTEQNYDCEIEEFNNENIICKIIGKLESQSESRIKITIFQGLPKADKMELVIQKSVELGVYNIIPVAMKRCVVKLDSKDVRKKVERWQKISEVAAKQCGRDIIPKVSEVIKVDEICKMMNSYDKIIVAYENEKDNKLKNEIQAIKTLDKSFLNKKEIKIGVVIGPEGGIDESEIEALKSADANIVTLGKRILRTETVALNVLSILLYELDD